MIGIHDFIVTPLEHRTTSNKSINGKNLIVNTDMQNHEFVSREAVVISVPLLYKTDINVGDIVIVHHNVFRRFYSVRGEEKWSKSRFNSDLYFASLDQVYGVKTKDNIIPLPGYCFVAPIVSDNKLEIHEKEAPLIGVLKYSNSADVKIPIGNTIGFTPGSEFEFILNNKKLYRVKSKNITVDYGHKGTQKEYNPSWVCSG